MRFLRLRVRHFGPITDFDTGEDSPLTSLVVVLGPNEAGKSTLRAAVLSLLFGFYPATRDGNPLAPWSGESPELRGWFRVGDTPVTQIYRRLLSRPQGQILQGDSVSEIRNQELAPVRHLRKEVFEQVYAVTLPDLANLRNESWKAIQDRLVVGMGSQDLVPPREAARDLQSQADALWRPDRRSTPRHRKLLEEIRDLQRSAREARDTDRRLRELHRAIPTLEERLLELRREEADRGQEIRKINRLLPLSGRLRQLDTLARRAGPSDELAPLPTDPGATLSELDQRITALDDREKALEEELARAQEGAAGLSADEASILADHAALRSLVDQTPLLRERTLERGRLEGDRKRLKRRIAELQAPLFRSGESPEPAALQELAIDRLRELIHELNRAAQRLDAIKEALDEVRNRSIPEAAPSPPPFTRTGITVGLLLLSLAIALGWFWEGAAPGVTLVLAASGVAALAVAGSRLLRWRTRADMREEALRAQQDDANRLELRSSRLQEDTDRIRERLKDTLAPLPLRPGVVSDPSPALIQDLDRLRSLFLDQADMEERVEELEAQEDRVGEALQKCRESHDKLGDLSPDPLEALPDLGRRLDHLQTRAEEARLAQGKVARLKEEMERLQDEREPLQERRDTLLNAIRRAGGRDVALQEALTRAVARLEAARDLRRIQAELQRERPQLAQEKGELEAARQSGEAWLHDPDAVARLEEERSELVQEREEVRGQLERLREEARTLEAQDTSDVVEGQVLALQEEMEEVARERDRLFLLGRLIQVAERRFREEHQPDLLRRAGQHLAGITRGRYPRFVLADSDHDEPFVLDAPHLPAPLTVDAPLSTGTREQAYLALRLAIVDHLDEGREPLPLFLDEVLVNWDPARRAAGLELLTRLSGVRQVFLFTCDPSLAQEVEERGGHLVHLPAPESQT